MANRYLNLDGTRWVSETYDQISTGFDKVQQDMDAGVTDSQEIQADIINHKNSTMAHSADHITYTGDVAGATNVKQAVDTVKTALDQAIIAGDSGPEAAAARASISGTIYPTLGDRLDGEYVEVTSQLADKASKRGFNVMDYGAVNNTDSTIAIQAAIDACSANGGGEVLLSGMYLISAKLVSPLGVVIIGNDSCELAAIANIDAIIDLADSMKNVYINGNNMASKGVQFTRDYCYLERCIFAYCDYGVYNAHDVHKFMNCSFQNCTYGIYSADRFINSFIYGMVAQNNQYGIYVTYTDQQPQALFITHSLFFGNSERGIYIHKDIFVLCITDCVFDGIQPRAIMLNGLSASLGADITIKNCFIGSSEVSVWIGAGYSHVVIDNNRIDNGSYMGLTVWATETVRSSNVTISNNSFGNNASGDVQVDSVDGCWIEKNGFGLISSTNIISIGTFVGNKPRVMVKMNRFQAPNRVSSYNVILKDNIGYVTKNKGVSGIGNGFTTVTINHGLDVTPLDVTIKPHGDLGYTWTTNYTATSFVMHCSKVAVGDIAFGWEAEM